MRQGIFSTILILLTAGSLWACEQPDERKRLNFFETKIRPILVTHCYPCHASDSKSIHGGLLVDSRQGLIVGGESGPAVVPGDIDNSILMSALKYESFEMPPKGKLSADVIADFEKWVRDGATDPRREISGAAKSKPIDIESGRKHWAYQPLVAPSIPKVNNTAWPSGSIDRFILARLENVSIVPNPEAPKSALIRRLFFDLTGLPPTPEQIQRFVDDRSPMAYEKLVDRLLESPRFGERWGRHWLDISRFAESVTLRGILLKHAWRYRDYVIQAFNEDRPYDQFLQEQIAGDLLPASTLEIRQQNRVATTFLMMGNTNLEEQNKAKLEMDFVDEQLDVIGKGLLGQTITCARCHDHKFDPIPTRDYYAMAGILKNAQGLKHANVSACIEVPLPISDVALHKLKVHRQAVEKLNREIETLKSLLNPAAQKTIAPSSLPGIVVDDGAAKVVGNWTHSVHSGFYVGKGYLHDANTDKGNKTLSFIPKIPNDGTYEVRFAYQRGSDRPTNVPVTVFSADGEKTVVVNQRTKPPIDGRFISLGTYRFEAQGQSFVIISNEATKGFLTADAVQFLPISESDKLANPNPPGSQQSQAGASTDLKEKLAQLTEKLKKLKKRKPPEPMTLSVVEKPNPQDLNIHIRGSVGQLGEVVPRGVLQVANLDLDFEIPLKNSGRLELVNWMIDPRNPLTSRVMVNRVWHWLFGAGLVRTVDNFGTTGESPSHPKLLDHLATQFIERGWSVKELVRSIVLSKTYRLASNAVTPQEDNRENRLLAYSNRRRLDAEAIRDTLLWAGGTLNLEMGGVTFPSNLANDYDFKYQESRRSIYAPVFRNSLPEIFDVFDFANPSMVTGRRNTSTVAPQALFMMNHPFVRAQATRAAQRLLDEQNVTESTRIDRAYLLVLGRHPTRREAARSQEFLEQVSNSKEQGRVEAWTQLVHSLFSTIEFRYLR